MSKKPAAKPLAGGEVEPANPAKSKEPEASASAAEAKPPEVEFTPGRPICPYCKVPCGAGSSADAFTRYYCPTEGCDFSTKVIRPEIANLGRRREQAQAGNGPPR